MGANHSIPYRENFSPILYVSKGIENITGDVKNMSELFFAIKNSKSENFVHNICSRLSHRQLRAVWLCKIQYKPFRKPAEITSVLHTAGKMGIRTIIRRFFFSCSVLTRNVPLTTEEKDGCILILDSKDELPFYVTDPVDRLLRCDPVPHLTENKRELAILVSPPNGIPLPPAEPEEILETVSSDKVCIVCNTRAKNTVNVPCGHISCCVGCIRQYVLTHKKTSCMICKQPIKKVIKVYS